MYGRATSSLAERPCRSASLRRLPTTLMAVRGCECVSVRSVVGWTPRVARHGLHSAREHYGYLHRLFGSRGVGLQQPRVAGIAPYWRRCRCLVDIDAVEGASLTRSVRVSALP